MHSLTAVLSIVLSQQRTVAPSTGRQWSLDAGASRRYLSWVVRITSWLPDFHFRSGLTAVNGSIRLWGKQTFYSLGPGHFQFLPDNSFSGLSETRTVASSGNSAAYMWVHNQSRVSQYPHYEIYLSQKCRIGKASSSLTTLAVFITCYWNNKLTYLLTYKTAYVIYRKYLRKKSHESLRQHITTIYLLMFTQYLFLSCQSHTMQWHYFQVW